MKQYIQILAIIAITLVALAASLMAFGAPAAIMISALSLAFALITKSIDWRPKVRKAPIVSQPAIAPAAAPCLTKSLGNTWGVDKPLPAQFLPAGPVTQAQLTAPTAEDWKAMNDHYDGFSSTCRKCHSRFAVLALRNDGDLQGMIVFHQADWSSSTFEFGLLLLPEATITQDDVTPIAWAYATEIGFRLA